MPSGARGVLSDTGKEGLLLPRHRRSRRDVALQLSLTALLSVVIVLTASHLVFGLSASNLQKFEDSGVTALTSSQLVSHSKQDHSLGYWFGPRGDSVFSDNDNESGTDAITYLPKGSKPSNNIYSPLVTIVTYDNDVVFSSETHSLSSGIVSQFVSTGGRTIKYSPTTLEDEIVTIPGKPQVVVITYPTRQTAETLKANADNLQPVR